jgi:hypothetical protein
MLRVKSISISRFRGIREGVVGDFADVNVLVGRNNSGKSTVVEAIHRLAMAIPAGGAEPVRMGLGGRFPANPAGGADPLGRNAFNIWPPVRGENGPFPPELWYNLDQSETITVTATVGKPDAPGHEVLTLSLFQQGNDLSTPLEWNYAGQAGADVHEIIRFLAAAGVFRPEDARNVAIEQNLWPKLIGPRGDKHLTQALNTIFGLKAEGHTLLHNKVWVLFANRAVPLDSQGDGNRAALRYLIYLAVLRRTLLISEELECHQHPASLAALAQAVCKQAKEQEVQLFISTHSSECVRAFLAASREAKSESAVFHLKLADGILDATRLLPQAAQTLLDTGVDVRFLDLYG